MLYNLKESDIMIIEVPSYPTSLEFKPQRIDCYNPIFDNELSDMVDNSGTKEDFAGLYNQRLRWLDAKKEHCFLHRQWFERLKHDKSKCLFSMKFKSGTFKQNLRILFICTKQKAILLTAFVEKDAKSESNTSYNKNVKIANDRIESLINSGKLERNDIICHSK